MTALNLATQIPSNIATVEQLSVWCATCLATLSPNLSVVEGVNYNQNAAQSGSFYVAAANITRHIARQSIEMDPTHEVGGLKTWMYAKELSQQALTATMITN